MKNTILPNRRSHETPRLCVDAYTVGSNPFESDKAKEKSSYYITYRRLLEKINPSLYKKGDSRMIFAGLQFILDKLFYEPITHEEIDRTKEFLKGRKVTTKGFVDFYFPEEIWRTVVDKYNGRPPIKIKAMPEGSVVYPNEPVVIIESQVEGMGILAAWFEERLLKVWAASERITQNMHWFSYLRETFMKINPELSKEEAGFFASIMLHDFGARAGITDQESEVLGAVHLYTFGGTDTFSGAYQAFMNCDGEDSTGLFSSVNALAHRNVQSYEFEKDCYGAVYDASGYYELISMVADCYNFKNAVRNYLLPLAKRSVREGNGKVVVGRPDSGNALEQVLWMCRLAVENGLYETRMIGGKEWKFATTLHFIEGDGMTFDDMREIIGALIDEGFMPYSWGLFGVGGGLRNSLKRDNFSAKYALCAIGNENIGVVKYGEVGKTTLPGLFKVLRSPEALAKCETIVKIEEEGNDAMVEYFNGARINKPFGVGQDDNFLTIKARIFEQFDSMPLTLQTEENGNYPASKAILDHRVELLNKYQKFEVHVV